VANQDYAIPWAIPDISQGARFLLGSINARRDQERADENARTQRMFAQRNLEVQSAAAKREEMRFKLEQERLAHQREVERANAIGPLMQAAQRFNPAVASAMGKPHGISFANDETTSERVRPDLFGAAQNAFGDFARQKLAEPDPPQGPDVGVDAVSGGEPIAPQPGPPAVDGPSPVEQEIARLESVKPRLMMNVGDQAVEVPASRDASTGLGPEYDRMFNQFRQLPGVSEEDALKLVFQEHKAQQGQEASANRTADTIASRERLAAAHRPDVETLEKWLMARLNQSDINSRRAANAKIQSAGVTPNLAGLAELIRMKEEGQADSDIAGRAADLKIQPKAWATPVKESGRQGEKHSQLTVTGPDGEVLGEAHDAVAKRRLDDANIAFTQLVERTRALSEDVKQHGARIMPWDFDGQQRRESLKAAAASAGRKYHELGVSNANIELEHKILGPAGTLTDGFIKGANADVIDETLKEAMVKHKAGMAVRLRSGEAGNRVQPQLPKKKPAKQAGLPGHGRSLPAGAIPGKLNGRRGYVLNGEFHPTE